MTMTITNEAPAVTTCKCGWADSNTDLHDHLIRNLKRASLGSVTSVLSLWPSVSEASSFDRRYSSYRGLAEFAEFHNLPNASDWASLESTLVTKMEHNDGWTLDHSDELTTKPEKTA